MKEVSPNIRHDLAHRMVIAPAILAFVLVITTIAAIYLFHHYSKQMYFFAHLNQKPAIQLKSIEYDLALIQATLVHLQHLPVNMQESQKDKLHLVIQNIDDKTAQLNKYASSSPLIQQQLLHWNEKWSNLKSLLITTIPMRKTISPELVIFIRKSNNSAISHLEKILSTHDESLHLYLAHARQEQIIFTIIFLTLLVCGLTSGLISSQKIIQSIRFLVGSLIRNKQEYEQLLNNLNEGFLIINERGLIKNKCSNITIELFGRNPTGKLFHKITNFSESDQRLMKDWYEMIFAPNANISDLLPLAPSHCMINNKYIKLEYRPVHEDDSRKSLKEIICSARDKTEVHQLKNEAAIEKSLINMLLLLHKDPQSFEDFLLESEKIVLKIKSFSHKNISLNDIKEMLRLAHSLKGNSSTYHSIKIHDAAEKLEDYLISLRDSGQKSFDQEKDQLTSRIQNFVHTYHNFLHDNKSFFDLFLSSERTKSFSTHKLQLISQFIFTHLGSNSNIAKLFVQQFLLENVHDLFKRFENTVYHLAQEQNKDIQLYIIPSSIKVYPEPYKDLLSSLVHAFRNAIDHGIESADEKAAIGKREPGIIYVTFSSLSNKDFFKIEISDNGRGISEEKILQVALDAKFILPGEKIPYDDLIQLVFVSGLTTRKKITTLSGRGVGLDAINVAAEKLGGSTQFKSQEGKGATLILTLPVIQSPIIPIEHSRKAS